MEIHILFVDESFCGWCQERGFYWLAVLPQKKRILRARGPFRSRDDALRSAGNANPSAPVVHWNSSQPDMVLWDAGVPLRSKFVIGA
jgi:hypothetical protein